MKFEKYFTRGALATSLLLAAAMSMPALAKPKGNDATGVSSPGDSNANGNGNVGGNGTPDDSGATLCSAGPTVLSVNDVTFSASGFNPSPATDCFGVVMGNDTKYGFNLWGGGWMLADKTDGMGSAVSLFGGSFLFYVSSAGNAGGFGTWQLSATDQNGTEAPNLPIYLDLLVVLKGSDRFGVYMFDDFEVDDLGGGSWEITYENNGGNIPGLSHLSFLVREGRVPPSECTDPNGCEPQQEVPTPGTLALFGLGLAAATGVSRRHGVKR